MRAKKNRALFSVSLLSYVQLVFSPLFSVLPPTMGGEFFATIPFDFASAPSKLLSRKLFLAVSNWFPVGKVIGLL